ncbi:MAG: phasin family protein, partial [Rhodocyclaceae bacterium]|nr:phasin family protein [Rhodocyclaceae bacterium]
MHLKLVSPEECAALAEANVESSVSLVNSLMVSVERIVALNLDVGRSVMEEGIARAKAMLAAKDPQALLAVHAAGQPDVSRLVEYSRTVFDIVTQTQEDISRMIEEKVVEGGKRFTDTLQGSALAAPYPADLALAAMRQAMSGADAAYDNIGKALTQVATLAQSQLAAATRMALEVATKG